jgi:hypothetical protein
LIARLRQPIVVAACIYVVVALLLCSDAIFGGAALGPDAELDRHPPFGHETAAEPTIFDDITFIYLDYPRNLTIARGLQAGRLDLWNPLSGCGAPLWAEQGGPFFPLKLLFYLHPTPATLRLFIVLRLAIAALGAYALARSRGLGAVGAFGAGLLFELSGVMVAQLGFATSSAICMTPWALLGAQSLANRGTPRSVAGCAIALGITGLSGHPGINLLVLSAFLVAIGGHLVSYARKAQSVRRLIGQSAVALVLGAALMAPSILPLVELRAEGRTYKHSEIGESAWQERLDWGLEALPAALFTPSVFESDAFAREARWPWPFSPALSMVGLALGVAGIVLGGIDLALAAVGLFGLGLTTSFPGLGWLHHVPGLTLILSWYCWVLVVLPFTQAAGRAIERLDSPEGRRAMAVGAGVVLASVSSIGLLELDGHRLGSAFTMAKNEGFVWGPLASSVLLLVLCVGLAWLPTRMRETLRPGPTIALVAALHAFALLRPLVHHAPAATLSRPPPTAIAWLAEHLDPRTQRMHSPTISVAHPFSPMLYDLPDLRGFSALPIRRYARFMESIPGGVSAFTAQHAATPVAALLDVAAVRWLLEDARAAWLPQVTQAPNLHVVHADALAVVLENRAALPRARIVHEAIAVADEDEAAAMLVRLTARAPHAAMTPLVQRVLLEPVDGHPPTLPTAAPVEAEPPTTERVEILPSNDPDRVTLDVELSTPGWVVLADTYYPGWTAEVDGAPTPIHPANLAFRAVGVAAGSHRVELQYRPASFQLGVALFIASFAACLVLACSKSPGLARALGFGSRGSTSR